MQFLQKVNYFKGIVVVALLACLTRAPVQADYQNLVQLKKIEACMDHSIDPCEDFNGYACGNWPRIHAQDPYDDIGGFIEYTHFSKMLNLMQEHYPMGRHQQNLHFQNFIDKAAAYLNSCLNVKNVEILKYLDEIKPGRGLEWPLIDDLHAQRRRVQHVQQRPWSSFDAFALLGQLHSYGFNRDVIKQSTQRVNGQIITVLTIPEESDFDIESARFILQKMNLTHDFVNRQLEELVKTHSYWQASYKDYAEFGEIENLFSYDDINQTNPKLDNFLQHILPQHLREKEAFVSMPYWDYIQSLVSRQWPAYDNQKFCNYLMVRFLTYLKDINAPGCLATGQERMHLAYDYLYFKHLYIPEGRDINKDITAITKQMHKHFLSTIYENHVNLSHTQIQAIRQVLGSMTINIGNLPEKVDEAMLEKFYSHIPPMDVNNFYANDLMMLKHRVLESVICLPNMSCDEQTLESFPVKLYNDNMVIITFTALNSPVYQPLLDPLLSISSLGALLGHEFAHAIEPEILSSGSFYDISFEHIIDRPHIKEALQCMQRQEHTDFPDERIADLMGARVAYRAYSREYNAQPNFTNIPWKQLFFLNIGQTFCAKKDSFAGTGSFGERLNQIAMNMEAFAQAFHCRVGSKMNPSRKCRFY